MPTATVPAPVPAAFALFALLALSACSGTEPTAAPRPEPSLTFTAESPVEIPGRPGEAPTVIAPGEQGTVENPDAYADDDVAFVRDMAVHHAQALAMAALAPDRAGDARVRALAERIALTQDPEIAFMQQWLREHGLPEVDLDAAHHGMPGMASDEQLFALGQAEGGAFDQQFLQLMTTHHEGALQMADQATGARNLLIRELIEDVAVKQAAEIGRMSDLAADL